MSESTWLLAAYFLAFGICGIVAWICKILVDIKHLKEQNERLRSQLWTLREQSDVATASAAALREHCTIIHDVENDELARENKLLRMINGQKWRERA